MAGPFKRLARKVTDNPPPNPLLEAVKAYKEVHGEIVEHIGRHPEVFTSFFAMVQKYNAALDKARSELQQATAVPAGLDSEFRRAEKGSCKVSYVAERLPPEVLAIPGVVSTVKTVDKTILEKLIKVGVVSADAVAPAKVETFSAPSVFVPAPLEFKFKREL